MRQEFAQPGDGMVGDASQDVFEPSIGIDAGALTGGHEAPQHCGRLAVLVAAKEHPVIAADRHTADGALGGVVVDLQVPVFGVAGERRPVLEGVTGYPEVERSDADFSLLIPGQYFRAVAQQDFRGLPTARAFGPMCVRPVRGLPSSCLRHPTA